MSFKDSSSLFTICKKKFKYTTTIVACFLVFVVLKLHFSNFSTTIVGALNKLTIAPKKGGGELVVVSGKETKRKRDKEINNKVKIKKIFK